ncbi:MAG: hypothetical protein OXB96_02655 [Candidatus Kaiserbacteria bacterium]|nr:hypothetical protein [Candidatus Kaiserbacteria bacterium]
MSKLLYTVRLIAMLLLTFCVAVFVPSVSAIEYGGIGGQPAYPRAGVPQSTSKFLHTLKSGEVAQEGVMVLNTADVSKTIVVRGVGVVGSSDGGLACAQAGDIITGVGTWITLEESEVYLAVGSSEIVPFTITVPAGMKPGEYNGCVVIEEKKEGDGEKNTGFSLSTRIGIRVQITVPGDFAREITDPLVAMAVREDGGFQFKVSARNDGNVSIDTNIVLTMRSLMAGFLHAKRGGVYPIYPSRWSELNFTIAEPFWGGPYLTRIGFSYDRDGDGVRETTLRAPSIFTLVMPHPLALSIELGVLVGLIVFFVTTRRRRRKKGVHRKQGPVKRVRRRGKDFVSHSKRRTQVHPRTVAPVKRKKRAVHARTKRPDTGGVKE